jgi:pimeloyl-ACP methyl ester carboxylesterase
MARLQVAEGRSIYYEQHAGTRLPVVLIHGWGMSCRVWDTTLTALKQAGHEVITFDQRGLRLVGQGFRDDIGHELRPGRRDARANTSARRVSSSTAGRSAVRSRSPPRASWARRVRAWC